MGELGRSTHETGLDGPKGTGNAGEREPPGLGRQLVWFAGLWLAGVAAVTLVGLIIKTVLN